MTIGASFSRTCACRRGTAPASSRASSRHSLVGTLRKRRAWDEATESLTEVATILAERMVEGDRRDDRVAELTERLAAMSDRMESYGRTSVKLAAASVVVAVAALVVAVVVALA